MTRVAAWAAGLALSVSSPSAAQLAPAGPQCTPSGGLVRVPELREGSGIAASRATPGRFWAHNDSGQPTLVALDAKGGVTGLLQLTGAKVEDWEAVTVGPCPSGSCIHVGDIGDNDAERRQITVYRVAEPSGDPATARAEVLHATYPDGAHDAESLFITPDGRLHLVTKGDTGPVALYRFPADLRPGATHRLERVAGPPGKPAADDRITDAAASSDGQWVALRSNSALMFHRAAELLAGNWREAGRVDLEALDEPQGEGIAFGSGRALHVVGEGGGKSQPGTFGTLTCTIPS